MVYEVCVCQLNACVYSVNWVGVLYNVGIRVLWSGGRRGYTLFTGHHMLYIYKEI